MAALQGKLQTPKSDGTMAYASRISDRYMAAGIRTWDAAAWLEADEAGNIVLTVEDTASGARRLIPFGINPEGYADYSINIRALAAGISDRRYEPGVCNEDRTVTPLPDGFIPIADRTDFDGTEE